MVQVVVVDEGFLVNVQLLDQVVHVIRTQGGHIKLIPGTVQFYPDWFLI
jgi:hypothetical protein